LAGAEVNEANRSPHVQARAGLHHSPRVGDACPKAHAKGSRVAAGGYVDVAKQAAKLQAIDAQTVSNSRRSGTNA